MRSQAWWNYFSSWSRVPVQPKTFQLSGRCPVRLELESLEDRTLLSGSGRALGALSDWDFAQYDELARALDLSNDSRPIKLHGPSAGDVGAATGPTGQATGPGGNVGGLEPAVGTTAGFRTPAPNEGQDLARLLGMIAASGGAAPRASAVGSPPPTTPPQNLLDQLPLTFEVNEGQTDAQVQFLARGPGYHLFLTADGMTMALPRPAAGAAADSPSNHDRFSRERENEPPPVLDVLRSRFMGARPDARAIGLEEQRNKVNYFLGNDPSRWRTDIATYARVKYEGIYDGVDLVYYGTPQRQLEYDWVVAPGADPGQIRQEFEGADRLAVDAAGDLHLHTAGGEVVQHAPKLYQEVNGAHRPVAGRYVVEGRQARVHVEGYDRGRPLVIDPVLGWTATGSQNDEGLAIDQNSLGEYCVSGWTLSADFLKLNPLQPTLAGGQNAFVFKAGPNGMVYSTYLGGGGDSAYGAAIDEQGQVSVTGHTMSSTFPLQNPLRVAPNGSFVAKLSATGNALVFSTYLDDPDFANGTGYDVATDNQGNVYVTGLETHSLLEAQASFNTAWMGQKDAFVIKLDPVGTQALYASYLGGAWSEEGRGIAVDCDGNAYVTGPTDSIDFMTVNAYQNEPGPFPSSSDAFVAKINPQGTGLVYSTYLGGMGDDEGNAIAVDKQGNAYVTGNADWNFPLQNPFQSTNGGPDAFVTKFNAAGTALIYSTYLGGSSYDYGRGIAVNEDGEAYVVGQTSSMNFLTPLSPPWGQSGLSCGFIVVLTASGTELISSNVLSGYEAGFWIYAYVLLGVAVSAEGDAIITGWVDYEYPIYGTTHRDVFLTGVGAPWTSRTLYGKTLPVSVLDDMADPQDTGGDDRGVYVSDGEYHYRSTDLSVPGRGFDWRFERSYRSGVQFDGPLGHNWDFLDNRRLLPVTAAQRDKLRLTFPGANEGDVIRFDGRGRADLYVKNGDGSYTAPRGFFTRLVKNPDGTFSERDAVGTLLSYGAPNARGFAPILTIKDRNGNTQEYEYDTQERLDHVTDTLGRTITYSYDENNKISAVTDFSGRSVQFQYDDQKDLIAVTSPAVTGTPNGNDFPDGTTEEYTYSTGFGDHRLNHNLLTVTSPNEVEADGPPRVTLTYNNTPSSANVDRVLTQTLGGTNASNIPSGGTITYTYPTTTQTTVLDRSGNQTDYGYDARGNITSIREYPRAGLRNNQPTYFQNAFSYNQDDLLVSHVFPAGNRVDSVYDSANPDRFQQGNLLSTIAVRDNARGGDQAQLKTTFTYEPIFNQVLTATDPRGNDASYYPAFGGPNSAGRYRTVNVYDYQEGSDYTALADNLGITTAQVAAKLSAAGVPVGLGDVNGDGTTSQEAGNLVRTQAPTVHLLTGSNQANLTASTTQGIVTLNAYDSHGQPTFTVDPEGNRTEFGYYPEGSPNEGAITPDGGGYLARTTVDTTAAPGRDNGLDPSPANISHVYHYDQVGNLTREVDGRGVATDYVVNALNQVVQTSSAAAVGEEGLGGDEPLPLTAFQYLQRFFYDANGNMVLSQVEDRGNTSGVDGNLPAVDLPAAAPDPDAAGGPAYVDTAYKYDILGRQVETVQEVQNGAAPSVLRTGTRYDANGNPVLTILPEGNASAAVYDERDLLFQTLGGTTSRPAAGLYAPNDPATLTRPGKSSPATVVTYNYDGNRNLTEVVDAVSQGGAASTVAGDGDMTSTAYDGFDRPKVTTDALGNQTFTSYDPVSNPVRVIQKGAPVDDGPGSTGNVTLAVSEAVYDELSRAVATHQVLFTTPGNLPTRPAVETVNPSLAQYAPYLVGAASNTAAVPGATDITVLGRVTTLHEYDRNGRETFTVSPALGVTRTDYDGAGRPLKTTDSALSNGFNESSLVFESNGLHGNTVENAYDPAGQVIETKRTDVTLVPGVVDEVFRSSFFYDALGRLQTSVDPLGQATDYRYDSRGNLVATADANGPVTTRTLPRRGLGSTDPVTVNDYGAVTLSAVDGLSRAVQTRQLLTASGQGDGNFIGAELDGTKVPIPAGYLDATQGGGDGVNDTYQAWDKNSLPLARRGDNGDTTEYAYDQNDRLWLQWHGQVVTGTDFTVTTDFTGSPGYPGSFIVPLQGGVVPPQSSDAYSAWIYNADGAASSWYDGSQAMGSQFTASYDPLGRLTGLTAIAGSPFVGTSRQTWTYDGLSRPTSSFDNNHSDPAVVAYGSTTRSFYDSLSRLLEEQQQPDAATGWPAQAVSYQYDLAASGGVSDPSALVYPDGRQVDSTYDRLGRLVAKSDHGQAGPIGTVEYLGDRVATRTYQNRTRLSYLTDAGQGLTDSGYDQAGRVVQQRWESFTPGMTPLGAGTLVVGLAYQGTGGAPAYDRAGRLLVARKLHDPGNSEVYRYQADGQLQGFDRGTLDASQAAVQTPTTTPGVLQAQAWTPDGNGNWATLTSTTGGVATTETRTASARNELGTVAGTPYGGGAAGAYQSDVVGNLTDDGIRTYQWDAFHRLKVVTRKADGQVLAVFNYDAAGRRVMTTTYAGQVNGAPSYEYTNVYYDGQRVLEERDNSNAVTQQYVYGAGLDEEWVLDDRRNGVTVAQLNDGTGRERLFYQA